MRARAVLARVVVAFLARVTWVPTFNYPPLTMYNICCLEMHRSIRSKIRSHDLPMRHHTLERNKQALIEWSAPNSFNLAAH